MKVKINGEAREIQETVNITELLKIAEVKMPEMVSVEYNGEFLDREVFDTTFLKEEDAVEFLYFMGGGSIGF